MNFRIENNFTALFPDATIGVFLCRIVSVAADFRQVLLSLRQDAENTIKNRCHTIEELQNQPEVLGWRNAYQKFGVNPKKYRPTNEALLRRILGGKGWPDINPVVDAYLVSQVITALPHGGYDLGKINGSIVLDISNGNDPFVPFGGSEEFTQSGEVIYRDDTRILTRRWNFRDAASTAISKGTEEFVLMIESPGPPITNTAIQAGIDVLGTIYAKLFVVQMTSAILRVQHLAEINLSI